MRHALATTAILAALAAPGAAAAQQLSFSGGATLTSRYVADGIEQTTGAAFQPWIEGEINGFYFGAWMSNTARTITGSSTEIDLYVGYRNEVGRFSYDIGYARYIYRSPKFDCCGDLILAMGFAATDQLSLGVKVKHNPSRSTNPAKQTNISVSADYAFTDKLSMGAVYGKVTKGGMSYWSVGGSYAINDSFGIGLAYHDTSVSKGLAVLSLDYSFSFR